MFQFKVHIWKYRLPCIAIFDSGSPNNIDLIGSVKPSSTLLIISKETLETAICNNPNVNQQMPDKLIQRESCPPSGPVIL